VEWKRQAERVDRFICQGQAQVRTGKWTRQIRATNDDAGKGDVEKENCREGEVHALPGLLASNSLPANELI
jgi:hypothetical protein